MRDYDYKALIELKGWQRKMLRKPTFTNRIAKGMQNKINSVIPKQFHDIMTGAIKNMIKAVLLGSEYVAKKPLLKITLKERDALLKKSLNFYKKTAATSGAGTGAGGLLLGVADFPILLSLKMKFLFDCASYYGFDVKDYRERLYILNIFQLAFSSQERRNHVYKQLQNWDDKAQQLPKELDAYDWRTFQQEYRDYIDLAKLFQMIPGVGAVVGAYANYQLMDKLGETAINAYRMRILKD